MEEGSWDDFGAGYRGIHEPLYIHEIIVDLSGDPPVDGPTRIFNRLPARSMQELKLEIAAEFGIDLDSNEIIIFNELNTPTTMDMDLYSKFELFTRECVEMRKSVIESLVSENAIAREELLNMHGFERKDSEL